MKTEEKFIYLKDVKRWYCDEEGNVWNTKGQKIGTPDNYGYLKSLFQISDKKYHFRLHQFVFWFFNGFVAKNVDHIDRNKLNNAPSNLREVTHQENQWNRDVKGYTMIKSSGRFIAAIKLNNKRIHLGVFDTADEAHAAYLDAKARYHRFSS